jgi:hypothetical protein
MTTANSQTPPLWSGIKVLACRPKLLLLIVGGLLAALVLNWFVYETRFYRAAIPAEIGLSFDFATTGSNVSFLGAVFLFDRKACGGAIFELTDTTVAAIHERGPDFLKDARQGRGYAEKHHPRYYYYSYQPWQPTPLAPEWTSNGKWLGLSCMGLKNRFGQTILQATREPGSFYTTGQNKMLLLIPSLKLAVFTYTH